MDSQAYSGFRLMVAPLQGYTEAPLRHFHAEIYGGRKSLNYFTPFVRMEKGEARPRDLRDACSELNGNHSVRPQIIFRDAAEFTCLVRTLRDAGHKSVDLNLGCPFTPQVRKGRGAGTLRSADVLGEIAELMCGSEFAGMDFSVKMRLGVAEPEEWQALMPLINSMPLTHICLHPRTAAQQYAGELHEEQVAGFINRSAHPVILNGEIKSPEMIDEALRKHPGIAGVMVGRGLLMRPSIFAEWLESREWTRPERIASLRMLHDSVAGHYAATLSGDSQILSKIKPLWDYFGADFERKAVKKIAKATSLAAYHQATDAAFSEILNP